MPAFIPPAKPVLRASGSSRTLGKASRSCAGEPSVEPLSTTSTSSAGRVCASTEARHRCTICPPFQFRTTTEVDGGDAGTGLPGGGGRSAPAYRPP
jgi:hypothetical protein